LPRNDVFECLEQDFLTLLDNILVRDVT